jgi:hypothetical protein
VHEVVRMLFDLSLVAIILLAPIRDSAVIPIA